MPILRCRLAMPMSGRCGRESGSTFGQEARETVFSKICQLVSRIGMTLCNPGMERNPSNRQLMAAIGPLAERPSKNRFSEESQRLGLALVKGPAETFFRSAESSPLRQKTTVDWRFSPAMMASVGSRKAVEELQFWLNGRRGGSLESGRGNRRSSAQ